MMNTGVSKMIAGVIVVGVLALGTSLAAAQEADLAQVEAVTTAFDATRAVNSLHMTSQSLTEITNANTGMLTMQSTLDFDLVRAEEDWNAAGTLTTTSSLPFGEFSLSAELILVDRVSYVRFTELPEGIPVELPQGWVTADELTQQAENAGGQAAGGGLANALPIATTGASLLRALNLPLSSETVTAISTLPDDDIDGQVMRVYQLSIDPAAVLESDAAGLLSAPIGAGFGGGNLPEGFTSPDGVQLPTPSADIATPSPEDFQVTLAAYVGADDGFVHRIYLLVNTAGNADGSSPAATITTISDYSNFNTPVEIVAP
jgi:hypothetical protein